MKRTILGALASLFLFAAGCSSGGLDRMKGFGSQTSYLTSFTLSNMPLGMNTTFSRTGVINNEQRTVTVYLPISTTTTSDAFFADLTYADTVSGISVNGAAWSSSSTYSFANPVTFDLKLNDGTTVSYTVTVTKASEADAQIDSFGFLAADNTACLPYDCIGSVSGTSISMTVPYTQDLTKLIPVFSYKGETITLTSNETTAYSLFSRVSSADFSSNPSFQVNSLNNSSQGYSLSFYYTDPVPVTKVTIDQTSLTLGLSSSSTLSATISPYNASVREVSWTISNENISVTYSGKLYDYKARSFKILVTLSSMLATTESGTISLKINDHSNNSLETESCQVN